MADFKKLMHKNLSNREDVRIDSIKTIDLNSPSARNMVAFQLLIESNILSSYNKRNLDLDLFTHDEFESYKQFIDYSIDTFKNDPIRKNGTVDKQLQMLIRRAEAVRIVRMIDRVTYEIKDINLLFNRLSELSCSLRDEDAKLVSDGIYNYLKDDINLDNKIKKIIYNKNNNLIIEYLIHRHINKETNEDKIKRWVICLEDCLRDIKGPSYYRLNNSLVTLTHKFSSIQNAKEYLGYEKDLLK